MVNKKILGLITIFLAGAMLATPLVLAEPWDYPKNNDKFQTYNAVVVVDWFGQVYNFERAPPVEGKYPNLIVISWEEIMLDHTIIVGENEYNLGEDFEYTGFAVLTVWDPIPGPPGDFPTGSKVSFDVKYMYTFLPASGIEGTISMHAKATAESFDDVTIPGAMLVTSMEGTGDLINVNIKATGGADIGVTHNGIVSGWPE
jgi:hypothetical protein